MVGNFAGMKMAWTGSIAMSANVELLHSVVGQEPAARSGANDPGRKHRGLWSFLTRTFVLGQLIVAEHFFGNAARADDGGESLALGEGDAGSGGGASEAAAVLAAATASDESGAAAVANAQQAKTLAGAAPQAGGVGLPEAGARGGDMSADAAGARQGASGDIAYEQASADGDDSGSSGGGGHYEPGPGGGGDGGGYTDGGGTIIDPVIDIVDIVDNTIVDVVDTVVDVVGNVGDVVNDVVGNVGDVVTDVVGAVPDILIPTVDLVTDTAIDVIDTLTQTVSTTAGAVFDAANGILGSVPIVGEPLTAVTGLVEDVASTTLDTASTAITGAVGTLGETVTTVVADVFPAASNIVGSGVIPVLQGVVSGVTNPDTLYEGGQYSDFNIALQSASEPITGVVSNAGTAVDSLLDGVIDLVDLPVESPLHTVTNLLGDPLKGGLGELFS